MPDQNLIPYLKDIVARVTPFAGIMSFIHMKQNDDGTVQSRVFADDNSVQLYSTSVKPVDLEGAAACFGNIGYLNQLLTSSMIKNDTPIDLRIRERNEKRIVSSIGFTPNNRMELVYMNTDPFRASLTKTGKLKIDSWPVSFIMDADTMKEISEIKRIHAAAPSDGSKEDMVEISFNDGNIMMEYGGAASHNSTIALDVPVESSTKKTFSSKYLTDHFIRGMVQAQDKTDKTTIVEMCDIAIRFLSENSIAEHQMVIARRVDRDD